MEYKKMLLSALLFSGTLTLGLSIAWSQGVKGEGASPGKEGGATPREREGVSSQKKGMESPMGAKGEETGKRESQQAASGDVKQAQQALKEKGHDPGPIDGILGPKTQQALKAFQEANNLKATGRLDAETKGKLGLAGSGRGGSESRMGKVPESVEKREGKNGASD